MIGAIAGDVIGSAYERKNKKTKDFKLFTDDKRFTDDTVMTIATMDKLLNNKTYIEVYQQYGRQYPDAGYGKLFKAWTKADNPQPYNSYANGSAMRASPIGMFHKGDYATLMEAQESSNVTHNHPEAVNAATCVAMAVKKAFAGYTKPELQILFEDSFGYNMHFDLMEFKKTYEFDVSANGTMPVALKSFLDSTDYEDCIRLAISIGGDSDTIACIAGGIAEAYYKKIPDYIIDETRARLPDDFLELLDAFYLKIGSPIN